MYFFFIISCRSGDYVEDEISNLEIKFEIERFDQLFQKTEPKNLQQLKNKYPFLFPKQFNDSIWIAQMKDTLQQQIHLEVNKIYDDFESYESEIHSLFQHLKYYFQTFETPRLITVTSTDNFRNRIIVTDSIAFVSLNFYLGANHKFYHQIPKYIRQNFEPSQITPDLAEEFAKKYINKTKRRTFLDEIIYAGKILYFKDIIIPKTPDEYKIGYSNEDLRWAKTNEANIWTYFVENEILFNSDNSLISRFINPSPFSKFYLEIDSESPGRLGHYIGWQIVRSYMKNNNISFKDMLSRNAEEIFEKSKFKPVIYNEE